MKKGLSVIIVLLAFILSACTDQGGSTNSYSPGMVGDYQENSLDRESNLIGEKVIKTVTLNYETLVFSETLSHIQETINAHQAYIEYSYESSYSPSGTFGPDAREYKRVEYTLRVPTENLSNFLKGLEGMEATKVSEQIGSEDVTQTYRDTEARIEVLNQKETRLTELLAEATTIEQILQIEDNLSNTIAERESLQTQLESMDDLIAYTEVYLTVSERQRLSETRGSGISFWSRLKEAVLDSIFVFYYWLQDAVIWLVYALPFLIIIGLLLLLFMGVSHWFQQTSFYKKREERREKALVAQRERLANRKRTSSSSIKPVENKVKQPTEAEDKKETPPSDQGK